MPSQRSRAQRVTIGGLDTGVLLWKADGTLPLHQEWASINNADYTSPVAITESTMTSRVAVVTDAASPSPSGKYYRMTIADGDFTGGSTDSERNEVGWGNPSKSWAAQDGTNWRQFHDGSNAAGYSDVWIAWAHRLPANYATTSAWALLHQWKQTSSAGSANPPGFTTSGNPIMSLNCYTHHDGDSSVFRYFMWGPGNYESNNVALTSAINYKTGIGPAGEWYQTVALNPSLSTWHKFAMRVKFHGDPAIGFFELYGDLGSGWTTLVSRRYVPTLRYADVSGAGAVNPSHARMGVYRSSAYSSTWEVDYAGYSVATSRAAAEASAFTAAHRSS